MNLPALVSEIQSLDTTLARRAASAVYVALTARNWLIGAYIVEFEQNGEDRATYGAKLMPTLSGKLRIKGLSTTVIRHCRTFYIAYPAIRQSLTGEFSNLLINNDLRIPQPPAAESSTALQSAPIDILTNLSFTHIVELLKISDPLKRAFYEIEAIKGRWTVRDLKRQTGSLLFERTAVVVCSMGHLPQLGFVHDPGTLAAIRRISSPTSRSRSNLRFRNRILVVSDA